MDIEKLKEIKKALDYCTNHYGTDCYHCPYLEKGCNIKLMEDSLILINYLENYNVILNKLFTYDKSVRYRCFEFIKEIKDEALKQFAARLKEELKGIVGANFLDEILKGVLL